MISTCIVNVLAICTIFACLTPWKCGCLKVFLMSCGCFKIFSILSPNGIERIKEIEKRQGSIECKICNKVFSHGMVLCIHMKDNSKKWETANCPLCNKECQNMGVLNTHLLAIHIKAKPYKCRLCDFVTGRRSYALGHLEKRHEIQNDDGTHIEIITHEMNKVKTLQEFDCF